MHPLAAAAGTGLPLAATGLVLIAAVAHASWNAIAHDITDKLVGFTLLGLGGAACSIVVIVLAPPPDPSVWPLLLASTAVHIGYNVLLMTCYRLGDFSQVYPLARGTSPLVVTVLAAVFVREVPAPLHLLGVIVISLGLACLVFLGRRPSRAELPALAAALGTGLAIAGYSTLDGIAVRRSGSPAGYTGWIILLECLAIPSFALAYGRRPFLRRLRPHLWKGLAGGAISLLAYGLVLWAQTMGALASIAALRESSIIVGAIIGTLFFHERFGRPRLISTIVVVAGIVALNL